MVFSDCRLGSTHSIRQYFRIAFISIAFSRQRAADRGSHTPPEATRPSSLTSASTRTAARRDTATPEILLLAVDSDEEFVQIPDVAEATLFPLQTLYITRSEFSAPLSDGFERMIPRSASKSSTSRKLIQKR